MPWSNALIKSLPHSPIGGHGDRKIPYTRAVHEALQQSMSLDKNVFLIGQGSDDDFSIFETTRGLKEEFGDNRVFESPLSEEGVTGLCVGAAINGMRPVYMHNRPDFLLLAFNQIVNHAAKFYYMGNGKNSVPMVVWSAIGRGWGSGAQHSQAIYNLLLSVPGIKIVTPSNPFDSKGLLVSAIKDNNPVFVFEHRWAMRSTGAVPEEMYEVPIGIANRLTEGEDLTIVTWSYSVDLVLQAMQKITNISADVIDLRTIKPIDIDPIVKSVQKTGRLLIVDTASEIAGVASEVSFQVTTKAFSSLKAPPQRIGLPDVPTPAGNILENFFYPDPDDISKMIKKVMEL